MMYHISRFLFEVFFRVLLKVTFVGRENIPDAPYIAVANHASLADPPFVGSACKKDAVSFMAKKELFDAPILGAWTRSVNCIPVNRGSASATSLKEAIKRIGEGKVVAVFPEGTRSEDGNLQEAKRGIGFIIAKAKVPVVPIYIEGSNIAFPKGRKIKIGTPVKVIVGKPVMPEEFSEKDEHSGKQNYEKITNMVMERIAGLKS
ncbi:MAG: lysophospholipid acyltransferase family protein [Candidatus Omnitrophota bacterium]